MTDYQQFLEQKKFKKREKGFEPLWMPDFLFDFQGYLTGWNIRQGRSATFADCGLGKGPMALVWADNVVRKTKGRVLIVCPLAVSYQFISEGKKFGIEVRRSRDGTAHDGITVTNYERLKYFDSKDFDGIVADESSILKNFDGKLRRLITDFMLQIEYRLLCTATPAPNDFMELGTSAEALSVMTYNQMLSMFFVNDGDSTQQWRLKGHAKRRFWRWMASWSRAIRKPSDLGFSDDGFILPELKIHQHTIRSPVREGFFAREADTLNEQRDERRKTLRQRCEKVAEVLPDDRPTVAWCHLNPEGDLLTKLIPGAVQVKGNDSDRYKEETFKAFTDGEIKNLVSKPSIAGWGLNWQHCADMAFFVSHSHESFYQALRRGYRFRQQNEFNCHIIASEAESKVLNNMLRKERQSQEMYEGIVREMRQFVEEKGEDNNGHIERMEIPSWLK